MARPKKDEKDVRVQLNAMIKPDVYQEIVDIAESQWRTKSQVAEQLLMRGLAAFRRDGILTEIEGQSRGFIKTTELKEVINAPKKQKVK